VAKPKSTQKTTSTTTFKSGQTTSTKPNTTAPEIKEDEMTIIVNLSENDVGYEAIILEG
jgi:hypothetical protein